MHSILVGSMEYSLHWSTEKELSLSGKLPHQKDPQNMHHIAASKITCKTIQESLEKIRRFFFFPQHLFNWKVGRDGEIRNSETKELKKVQKTTKKEQFDRTYSPSKGFA
jgi:hypothetical protein